MGNPGKSPVIRSSIRSPNIVENASIFEIQEEMHAALDLPNLLGQAVDVSHDQINKILQVRSEQVTSLPLAHFLRYFTLNLFFANECEAISGRQGRRSRLLSIAILETLVTRIETGKSRPLLRAWTPITGKKEILLTRTTRF
jgi:hypothetical protein